MASADLAFALELADLADSLSLPRFGRSTCASRQSQTAVSRPSEGVFGEEEGDDGGAVRWVIDPIDGTKNFSRGVPVWASLIALEREDEVVCGVISAPALGHRWWAARGEGAFREGERIRVSAVSRLADASVSLTYGRDLVTVEPAVWHARSLGDFWQHALVAEGSVDAAVDARLAPWDYSALMPILEEAGGRVSGLDGGPLRPKEQVVASNGLLHEKLLALLTPSVT
jgi:histidinol-phosphatase